MDTDTYRVVYFAFDFAEIRGAEDRATVMARVLGWLGGTPPERPIVSVFPRAVEKELCVGSHGSEELVLRNYGGVDLHYEVSAGPACGGQGDAPPAEAGWLRLAPLSGTIEPGGVGRVAVTVDAAGLETGEHRAEITVSSDDPERETVVVPVVLEVAVDPDMAVAPAAIDITLAPGERCESDLLLTNDGCSDLLYRIRAVQAGDSGAGEEDCPWLSLGTDGGTVGPGRSESVAVTVDVSGLDVGSYDARIVVESNDPIEGRIEVPVSLLVRRIARPVRELPTQVWPGQSFDVTVTFCAPDDQFNGIGLTDHVPGPSAPWPVTVEGDWSSPNAEHVLVRGNRVERMWHGPYDQGTGFTAVYRVRVPEDTQPGVYRFPEASGSGLYRCRTGLEYYVRGDNYVVEVSGDSKVEVVGGALVTGATADSDGAVLAGTRVSLFDGDTLVASALSDGHGEYRLCVPQSGDFRVVAGKEGFQDVSRSLHIGRLDREYRLDFVGKNGLPPEASHSAAARRPGSAGPAR